MSTLPEQAQTHILFSHTAYQMAQCFEQLDTGISHQQAWTPGETLAAVSYTHLTLPTKRIV